MMALVPRQTGIVDGVELPGDTRQRAEDALVDQGVVAAEDRVQTRRLESFELLMRVAEVDEPVSRMRANMLALVAHDERHVGRVRDVPPP